MPEVKVAKEDSDAMLVGVGLINWVASFGLRE